MQLALLDQSGTASWPIATLAALRHREVQISLGPARLDQLRDGSKLASLLADAPLRSLGLLAPRWIYSVTATVPVAAGAMSKRKQAKPLESPLACNAVQHTHQGYACRPDTASLAGEAGLHVLQLAAKLLSVHGGRCLYSAQTKQKKQQRTHDNTAYYVQGFGHSSPQAQLREPPS